MSDTRVNILVVDDRPENLLALEAILEPLGERLIRATSGDEALRRLLEQDVALILLDVQMPGMNGFETARLIKARDRTRHIPIIFLTAISKEQAYVFRGYSVGAVDYLFKPFEPEILRSKVAVFVDLHRKQKLIAEQEQMLRDSERREMELRHVRELWQSQARFRDIVASAMDAIIAFDHEGSITLFNRAAERMFARQATTAIGTPIAELFPPPLETAQAAVRGLQEKAERLKDRPGSSGDQIEQVTSMTSRRFTGEEFPIEASVSVLATGDGRAYTLILRDVSERKRHEEALRTQAVSLATTTAELRAVNAELNQRQAQLEQAITARSRFYASMSHELRTPINAVLGYSTLLLEGIYGPLNEKQREGILRTQKAARHLLELVNDVLDLSKIEAGKVDLRVQPVVFPGLVEDLFVTVRPLADQYGSPLSVTVEGGRPARISSDPRRVRQILLNLLSNAIKFGKGRPIQVVCRTPDERAGGVVVEVLDQGDGIPPEDRERIFQEFVQLGKTQLQDGTGLGLPISRRLAELLGGSLTVDSDIGRGSTFRLTLPPVLEAWSAAAADQEIPRAAVDERDTAVQPVRDAALEPAGASHGPGS